MAVCTAGAIATVWACRDPTEVTLNISTDVDCNTILGQAGDAGTATGVKIVVGANGSELDMRSTEPVAQTSNQCTPGLPGAHVENAIGTFVIVPDQGNGSNQSFAVMVVVGVETAAQDCTFANSYKGCIVARRELSFVPHTALTLPIAVDRDCLNVTCVGSDQTCFLKHCQSANTKCASGDCFLAPPDDAGGTSSDDGPDDAISADDAGPDHRVVDSTTDVEPDVSSPDAAEDTTVETSPVEGAPPDAPIMDVTVDVPVDVGTGPGMDATPDVGIDAPKDVSSSDVVEASVPETSIPDTSTPDTSTPDSSAGDGGLLGSCVGAGTEPGVQCGTTTCSSGQVCCVDHDPIGMTTFPTCTAPGSCTAGLNGLGHQISSIACLTRGNCASGQVCCANPAPSAGLSIVCQTSCNQTFTQMPACSNTCECSSGTCKVALGGCFGAAIATCGGACP